MQKPSNALNRISFATWIGAAAALVCLGSGAGDSRAAPVSPQIWLGGVDPVVRSSMDPNGASDFMDLFEAKAPWERAASQVKVFQASTQFFSKAPDDMLRRLFEDLNRRHIAVASGGLMLSGDGQCGFGIEGYSAPRQMLAIAKRISKLGGTLSYVAMDGPLMGGHFYSGPRACRSSVEAIAREVADKIKQMRSVFPSLQVGEIEPLGITEPPDWSKTLVEWTQAYKSAVGEPMAFVHFDVQWRGPWAPQLRDLESRLRADGTRVGVVYNGFGADKTDQEWVQHAEEHFNLLERDHSLVPEDVIIQTWNRHPVHFLPENQPGTLTNLVISYATKRGTAR